MKHVDTQPGGQSDGLTGNAKSQQGTKSRDLTLAEQLFAEKFFDLLYNEKAKLSAETLQDCLAGVRMLRDIRKCDRDDCEISTETAIDNRLRLGKAVEAFYEIHGIEPTEDGVSGLMILGFGLSTKYAEILLAKEKEQEKSPSKSVEDVERYLKCRTAFWRKTLLKAILGQPYEIKDSVKDSFDKDVSTVREWIAEWDIATREKVLKPLLDTASKTADKAEKLASMESEVRKIYDNLDLRTKLIMEIASEIQSVDGLSIGIEFGNDLLWKRFPDDDCESISAKIKKLATKDSDMAILAEAYELASFIRNTDN